MPRIGTKRKGTKAERELFHLFWENNWGCARVAGSGSTQKPSSDLIAANNEQKRLLAIECKAIGDNAKYFEPEEIEQLAQFAAFMGAEPWFAMRFNRQDWFFIHLNDVRQTEGGSFVISKEFAREKGKRFPDLINSKPTV